MKIQIHLSLNIFNNITKDRTFDKLNKLCKLNKVKY